MWKTIEKAIASFFAYKIFKTYQREALYIVICCILICITLFIYTDVIAFLMNANLREYLIHALIGKWLIIIICVLVVFITIKPKNKILSISQKSIYSLKPQKEPLSEIEKQILEIEKLKSHGDSIMEEAKKRKNH